MTTATPKPRAGGHGAMCIWDDCGSDAIYCEGHAREYMQPDIDALRERERELVEALTYCEISTRADGQWADQSVHTFLLSILAKHGR